MSDFLLGLAGHFEGLNDDQIAKIEAVIPVAESMIAKVVANQALFTELLNDWGRIGPVVLMAVNAISQHQKGN